MTDEKLVEKFVAEYGEKYRRLFVTALEFLNENEPKYGLDEPMDRKKYLQECLPAYLRGEGDDHLINN
jgi:hypothetical protein